MKYIVIIGLLILNFDFVNAKVFEAQDLLRSSIASREGLKKGHDLSNILEIEKGNIFDSDFSPCIGIVTEKIINNICPNDPWVGAFLVRLSITCFRKGTEQEVIATAMMHSRCDENPSRNKIVKLESGVLLHSTY